MIDSNPASIYVGIIVSSNTTISALLNVRAVNDFFIICIFQYVELSGRLLALMQLLHSWLTFHTHSKSHQMSLDTGTHHETDISCRCQSRRRHTTFATKCKYSHLASRTTTAATAGPSDDGSHQSMWTSFAGMCTESIRQLSAGASQVRENDGYGNALLHTMKSS